MLIKTGKEVAAFSKLGGDISKLREFIMKKHRSVLFVPILKSLRALSALCKIV